MNIYYNEKKLEQISKEIKEIKFNIYKGTSELNKIKENNQLLEEIFNKYDTFYNNEVFLKTEQEKHIKKLINYLDNIISETIIPNRLLNQINAEQKRLLKILNEVRNELKKIEIFKEL